MTQQLDLALSTPWDDVTTYGFDLINGDLNMLAVKLGELFEYDHDEVQQQIDLFDYSPADDDDPRGWKGFM
jgi:hypothetical protein